MAGLVPAIHVFSRDAGSKGVDGRDKPGHDDEGHPRRWRIRHGAVEKTRTSTEFPPQRPQRCASTSSATTACRHARPKWGASLAKRGYHSKRDGPREMEPEIGMAAGRVEWRVSDAPVPYEEAVAAMEARAAAIRDGAAAQLVWLLEHRPLYTAGTSAQPADLLDPGGSRSTGAAAAGNTPITGRASASPMCCSIWISGDATCAAMCGGSRNG